MTSCTTLGIGDAISIEVEPHPKDDGHIRLIVTSLDWDGNEVCQLIHIHPARGCSFDIRPQRIEAKAEVVA